MHAGILQSIFFAIVANQGDFYDSDRWIRDLFQFLYDQGNEILRGFDRCCRDENAT